MKIINYELSESGWADASIKIKDNTFEINSISYLSDALGEMVRSILKINNNINKASWFFIHEPGETLIEINKIDDIYIEIRASKYEDYFGEDSETNLIGEFHGTVKIVDITKDVINICDNISNNISLEEYSKQWNNSLFPIEDLEKLRKFL